MIEDSKIVLKQNITVNFVDFAENESGFVLIKGEHRWRISGKMKNALEFIARTGDYDKLKESGILNELETVEFIEFLYKNDFIEGKNPHASEIKTNKSKYMWLKIPLVKEDKLEKLRFLSFFFRRAVMVSTFALLCITVMYALLTEDIGMKDFCSILSGENIMIFLLFSFMGTFVHELGHIVASLSGGKIPKEFGFVIYIISPSFYTNVSRSWELSRKKRILIDVGGIYFQAIYYLLNLMWSLLLNNKLIILYSLLGIFVLIFILNPFIKMDGYWVATDWMGITNLHKKTFTYLKSIVAAIRSKSKKNIIIPNINKKSCIFFKCYAFCFVLYLIILVIALGELYLVSIYNVINNNFFEIEFGMRMLYLINLFYIFSISVIMIKGIASITRGKSERKEMNG